MIPRYTLSDGYSLSRIIKGGWHLAGDHGVIDPQQAIKDMAVFVEDENNRARPNPNYGRLQEPDRVPGSNTPPLDRPLPAAQPW